MPLVPPIVGVVVGLYLTLVTVYFILMIVMSDGEEQHRPKALRHA